MGCNYSKLKGVVNIMFMGCRVNASKDGSRIRNENSTIGFSWMRKFALGLLKKETFFKASIGRK